MGFLDALGGLGRAASTIPERQDRMRKREELKANKALASAYSQAAAADDLPAMQSVLQKYGDVASPEATTRAMTDFRARSDQLRTREQADELAGIQLGTARSQQQKAELDRAVQIGGGVGFAETAAEQEFGARKGFVEPAEEGQRVGGLEDLLALGKRGEQIDKQRELQAEGQQADVSLKKFRAEEAELSVGEVQRIQTHREAMNAAFAKGNKAEAARHASAAGLDKTAELLMGEVKPYTLKEQSGLENTLRKQYEDLNKDFMSMRDAMGRIMSTVVGPIETPEGGGMPTVGGSAAGDLALIFNFMKLLDPGSVVRESEFRTAATAGSFDQRIQGHIDRVMSGKRLADTVRANFITQAKSLYAAALQSNRQSVDVYEGIAIGQKLNPRHVTWDMTNTERVEQMLDGTLDADSEIRKRYQTMNEGLSQQFSGLVDPNRVFAQNRGKTGGFGSGFTPVGGSGSADPGNQTSLTDEQRRAKKILEERKLRRQNSEQGQ